MRQPEEFCLDGAVCLQSNPFDAFFWALLSTAILALLVGLTLGYLRDARAVCEEERDRTRAEHDAFVAFADRITDIEPLPTAPAAAQPAGRSVPELRDGPPDTRLRAVQQAYRETVMAMDHYEEDYGEPLGRNMAAEFGEGLATAVTDGDQYTPQLQQALLQSAENARARRAEFLSTLDREIETLTENHAELTELQTRLERLNDVAGSGSFDELKDAWDRLRALEEECERIVDDRQSKLKRSRHESLDGQAFHEYVYRALPVSYPVLAETVALIDRVRTARRRVLAELTRRG